MKSPIFRFAAILSFVVVTRAAPAVSGQDCDLGLAVDAAAFNSTSKTVSASSSKKTTTTFSKASSSKKSASISASCTMAQSFATMTSSAATTGGVSISSGGSLPVSSGTSALSAAQTIATRGSFDGGMVMYDRGVSCTAQVEGRGSDAVFQIENGGSLSNFVIGPNQIEDVISKVLAH